MPDPYIDTEFRYAGDTCTWCEKKATARVVFGVTGRRKLPRSVPACAECKQRVETNAEHDAELRKRPTRSWRVGDP